MKVSTRIVENIEDLFRQFELDIALEQIKWPKCIAYENPGGDDCRVVYEVYVDGRLRFFAFAGNDLPLVIEDEIKWMKEWTRASEVTLLKERGTQALFELTSPFGIRFAKPSS